MAEVLEAYAQGAGGFERRVAIKRLLANLTNDESLLESFQDEAKIASQLHHANIVGVLDFGLQDGLPFLVLEFIDGIDGKRLRERAVARGQTIPVEIALHLVTEIAHAL